MANNTPKILIDERSRERARYTRDSQWQVLERIAGQNPLYICWWDKNRRHDKKNPREDLLVCGLITGMELAAWLNSHEDWTRVDEWSDERCAHPFHITDAGREALLNQQQFDMEPVIGGMVEPRWQAIPTEKIQQQETQKRRST